jgi:hypothetical protein
MILPLYSAAEKLFSIKGLSDVQIDGRAVNYPPRAHAR